MSRKTAFNGSAAGRRRAQRAHLQNPQTLSSDLIHRPTPSRAQIQAKGGHHTPSRIDCASDRYLSARVCTRLYRTRQLSLSEGNLCAWFAKKKESNGEVTPQCQAK